MLANAASEGDRRHQLCNTGITCCRGDFFRCRAKLEETLEEHLDIEFESAILLWDGEVGNTAKSAYLDHGIKPSLEFSCEILHAVA